MRRFVVILLLLFATFQMIAALTVMGCSLYILISAGTVGTLHLTSFLLIIPIIILVHSLFVIFNSFLIFFAIRRRSELLLKIFTSVLALIVILKLIAGSLYMSRSYMMKPYIKDFLNDAVLDRKAYSAGNFIRPMDILQSMFYCCGNVGYDDYWVIIKELPKSCCRSMNNCDNKFNEFNAKYNKTGCADPIYTRVFERPNLWIVIGFILNILIEIIVSGISLSMKFRNNRIQNENFNNINLLNGNLLE